MYLVLDNLCLALFHHVFSDSDQMILEQSESLGLITYVGGTQTM
jgi:hypothetical protein